MHRLGNEHIWALVASIVCGIAVASLLTGSGLPLLLIVVVVGFGFGASALRRRVLHRHVTAESAPRVTAARKRRRRSEKATEPAAAQAAAPPVERPAPRGVRGLPVDHERRAGARSRSLGLRPPHDKDDR
jgi:hypothetical protein